ncbi:MAG TPA: twin-arginine translocase subunit TatC [Anaerolineales bacterium]|nr:twin-arginine translocase subunit TatC [Anaerolineales bacterium]
MTRFFKTIWRVIKFPFVLIFNILAFPFRALRRMREFLNEEPPEDRPLIDTFSSLATEAETRASLWEHVEALRMHIFRALLGLAVGVGIAALFTRSLAVILAAPLKDTSLLGVIDVTESISVFMRIALISGMIIALPYIAFEIWLFAAPGLRPAERKVGLIGIPLATLFFTSGVVFTYYIMPAAIRAMEAFNKYMGFTTSWRPNSYYGFITGLMFWLGVFFEFPLVIYVLTSMGLVKPQVLAQQWRLAIVIISIIAAVVTPTVDPVNMGLVMLPMILLYFISIGLSYIAYAGRKSTAVTETSA